MLSWVLRRLSRRPAIWEAHSPDDGMTCMAPIALATETCRWFQPDSCQLTASARRGSTPWRRAVSMIICLVLERLGTETELRWARFRAAARTTALGYVRPSKVLLLNAECSA